MWGCKKVWERREKVYGVNAESVLGCGEGERGGVWADMSIYLRCGLVIGSFLGYCCLGPVACQK